MVDRKGTDAAEDQLRVMVRGLAIHREPENDELVVPETRNHVARRRFSRGDRAADLAHHVLGGLRPNTSWYPR